MMAKKSNPVKFTSHPGDEHSQVPVDTAKIEKILSRHRQASAAVSAGAPTGARPINKIAAPLPADRDYVARLIDVVSWRNRFSGDNCRIAWCDALHEDTAHRVPFFIEGDDDGAKAQALLAALLGRPLKAGDAADFAEHKGHLLIAHVVDGSKAGQRKISEVFAIADDDAETPVSADAEIGNAEDVDA